MSLDEKQQHLLPKESLEVLRPGQGREQAEAADRRDRVITDPKEIAAFFS